MPNRALLSITELEELLTNPKLIILDATIDKVNQKIDNTNITLLPNSLFFDIEMIFQITVFPYHIQF